MRIKQSRTWMKLARQAKGLSQESMAKAVDVSHGTYSSWEQGRQTPSRPAQRVLGEELGVDALSLFSEENQASLSREVA